MQVKDFLILEAIRKTDKEVPCELGKWEPLSDIIQSLIQQGFLEAKEDKYYISEQGKRAILLFNSERKKIIKPLGEYKEFKAGTEVFDGRLAKACKEAKLNNLQGDVAIDYLTMMNMFLVWDEFFVTIKTLHSNNVNWQDFIIDTFEKKIHVGVTLDSWKKLGEPLVQIERCINTT